MTGASRGIGRAIARAFAEQGDQVAVHHRDSARLAADVVAGLPGDGHVVVQSDLYAMGVTMYEMLTGKLPIEGTNYPQVIAAHLQHRPVAAHLVNPRIPEALSAVVMKALDKEKRDRWQSAKEFLKALDAAYPGTAARVHVAASVSPVAAVATPAPAAATPVPSGVAGSKYQPEQLSEISHKLATYVGPIASVLVRRASSSSNNLRELCDLVAAEIDSDEARQKFLTSVRGQLRSSGLL